MPSFSKYSFRENFKFLPSSRTKGNVFDDMDKSRRNLSSTSVVEGSGMAKLMFPKNGRSRSLAGDMRVLQSDGIDSVIRLSVDVRTRDDQYTLLPPKSITSRSSALTVTSILTLELFVSAFILLVA